MLISNLINSVTSTIRSDLKVGSQTLSNAIGQLTTNIVSSSPTQILNTIGSEIQQNIFTLSDVPNLIKGVATVSEDVALGIFNKIPAISTAPQFEIKPGSIKAADNTTITETHYHSEASIGDLSWLIYKGRMVSNTDITDKWHLYNEQPTTTHGFNGRVYVDESNKQVAITLEGTQPNSELGFLWLSKDGYSDLQIGTGVIPPQMREGYEWFKNIVADVENTFISQGYGISVAGHSLGGGLAQMIPAMYFIDTGKALPTIAEAGPGMLNQIKLYAQEQLLAGKSIHLPSGGTVSLHSLTTLGRADEAKAIVSTFKAGDFSNIVNLITELDPVGQVGYNADRTKDEHIGVSMKVPYLLTAREDFQDLEYIALHNAQSLGITTPSGLKNPLFGPAIGDISATRFDRHEPDQSCALWSGQTLGFKQFDQWGLGTAVARHYGDPIQTWSGSQLSIAEVKVFGSDSSNVLRADSIKDTMIFGYGGDDVIYGGSGSDMLDGGDGNDLIFGGAGDDYISGGAGNDILYGDAGNDILFGGAGDDILDGGEGDDLLFGGAGNDTLYWSAGNDILCGNEGDDTYIVREGAKGHAAIKWERNYTNFGNDQVVINGKMAEGSSLLFNFADEITFGKMKWEQNGQDIIMRDSGGNQAASVTFKNAMTTFADNSDKLDFKFTNGRLYVDDQIYHVKGGAGTVIADEDAKYAGNILVGSSGADRLVSGKGNDLLFGDAGADTFLFNNNFGNDTIIGSDSQDKVVFNQLFNGMEFSAKQSGNDLVIGYQQTGLSTVNTLTINNWFTSGDKVNDFAFADGQHYKVQNNSFIKI